MEASTQTLAPFAESAPAWTLSVVRPGKDRHRMIDDLRAVPKAALQIVFGRVRGQRIWNQTHEEGAPGGAHAGIPVPDAEISAGMVEYLSGQTAEALREHRRQAKAIALKITLRNGESTLSQMPFSRPTDDVHEITEAAMKLLVNQAPSRSVSVASISLTVTSVETVFVRERANPLGHPMLDAIRA